MDVNMVAKWFINEVSPDPLKLQKLLYFSQGISFCMNDEPLFNDDFEAWVHGPVIPKLYHKYKNYEYNPIDVKFDLPIIPEKVLCILEFVKRNYAKYDGKYLEKITHHQEPWLYARSGLDPDERINKKIPKEIIADYFINSMNQPIYGEWS